MKIVVQKTGDTASLLLVPEGHAEEVQLAQVKHRVLELGLEHWDSDSNNLHNWTNAKDWGFNLVLVREAKKQPRGVCACLTTVDGVAVEDQ